MEKYFKGFLIKLAITVVVLIVTASVFFYTLEPQWFSMTFLYILLIYTGFIAVVQFFLYKYAQKSMAVFNRAFMLITAGKLMVLIVFMLVLAFAVPQMFKYFLGELLLVYVIYSFIEIKDILSYIKSMNS